MNESKIVYLLEYKHQIYPIRIFMSSNTNHNKVTIGTILVAMGIIYGDIGTSPLYALRAVIGTREINEMLVYGGVSAIFWTLIFQTTVKYVWITLQADNQGEGGIFSLYALVKRYGKKLSIPAMIGATTLLADGIITPPISVASAVEGLANVESLKDIFVAGSPITIATIIIILSALFFVQRFGTHIIGKSFGPIMAIWFSMLLVVGTSHIFTHPEIIKALNPYYAYALSARFLALRCSVFMHYWCRSSLFRFRALWNQKYTIKLDIC